MFAYPHPRDLVIMPKAFTHSSQNHVLLSPQPPPDPLHSWVMFLTGRVGWRKRLPPTALHTDLKKRTASKYSMSLKQFLNVLQGLVNDPLSPSPAFCTPVSLRSISFLRGMAVTSTLPLCYAHNQKPYFPWPSSRVGVCVPA